MKINEVFYSIQGESTFVGFPTFFIRTTGCNLRCSYCDTKYSYHEGAERTIESLVDEALSSGARHVCVTGGEPLLQKDSLRLMSSLCDAGLVVSLETSGSKSIAEVDKRVKVILDVKTPDSGAPNSFLEENLRHLTPSTEFKFVICSQADLDWSEHFCSQYGLFEKFVVLYSPSFNVVREDWLAEQILNKKSRARLQLQLHKYIWSPTQRGV